MQVRSSAGPFRSVAVADDIAQGHGHRTPWDGRWSRGVDQLMASRPPIQRQAGQPAGIGSAGQCECVSSSCARPVLQHVQQGDPQGTALQGHIGATGLGHRGERQNALGAAGWRSPPALSGPRTGDRAHGQRLASRSQLAVGQVPRIADMQRTGGAGRVSGRTVMHRGAAGYPSAAVA
ncbi:hypothetical protein FQR65_LT20376 [Abscondita terminalis]|nr:hypothetical protein FQR65_LT20376 [Abscondita terminalis]